LVSEPELDADRDDEYGETISARLSCVPWFDNRNIFPNPVLIGETADAAFATRFRQVISLPGAPEPSHLLRLDYIADETLVALVNTPAPWPGQQRAKFLLEAAIKYLGRCHYMVRRESITDGLSQTLLNPSCGGPTVRSKCWVLFALGELYVTKFIAGSTHYPGLQYFAQAYKMLSCPDERPGLESVETLLLLVRHPRPSYSKFCNCSC